MSAPPCGPYKVFAALHDDTDKGWTWISLGDRFESRTTIRIKREFNGKRRAVYCEYREIDDNFVLRYDRSEGTKCMYFPNHAAAKQAKRNDVQINQLGNIAVISQWYRKALGMGGSETAARGGSDPKLCFDEPWFRWWRDLRAACQHPEPGIRVATKIAILGTWLGVTALLTCPLLSFT